MRHHAGLTSIVIVVLLTAGCNTVRYGGAPDSSFDVNKDIKELEAQFGQAASVAAYYKIPHPTLEDRNRFITGRLVLMNIQYVEFVRHTTQEKQLMDAASDILVLSLNLAGAAFHPETTKTALAVASAAITGSKIAINKEFFFDKTLPALVASMNAARKQALVPILEGMNQDLNQYPIEKAMSDLTEYFNAGTFNGAIVAIQSDAGAKADAAQAQIEEIVPQSAATIKAAGDITDAIDALTDAKLAAAREVLLQFEPTTPNASNLTLAQVKTALKRLNRKLTRASRNAELVDALKAKSLIQ